MARCKHSRYSACSSWSSFSFLSHYRFPSSYSLPNCGITSALITRYAHQLHPHQSLQHSTGRTHKWRWLVQRVSVAVSLEQGFSVDSGYQWWIVHLEELVCFNPGINFIILITLRNSLPINHDFSDTFLSLSLQCLKMIFALFFFS